MAVDLSQPDDASTDLSTPDASQVPPSPAQGGDLSQPDTVAPAAAAPDYGKMSLWDAAKAGVRAIPSNAVGMAGDLGRSVVNTLSTGDLPGSDLLRSGDAYVNKQLSSAAPETMDWVNKNVLGYTPPATDADYQKAMAPAYALGADYAKKYGSAAGFKEALATQPLGLTLDAASVIDPMMSAGKTAAANVAASGIRGSVSEAELGQALRDAAQTSKDAVSSKYADAYSTPGTFQPDAVNPIWSAATKSLGDMPNFPSSWETLSNSPNLANTKDALAHLQERLTNLPTGELDMPTLENTRRDLRTFADGANGSDAHAIGKLIEGFDNGVAQVATTPGMFSGDGAAAVQKMQDARAAHVDYMQTFGNAAPTPVKGALKALPADMSTASDENLHQAGVGIGRGLLNPGSGPALYQHLSDIGMAPQVNDYLRERMLNGTQGMVSKNLASPVATRIFSDAELQRAQALNQNRNKISLMSKAAPALKAAANIGATAYGAGHAGFVGAGMGHLIERGAEQLLPKTGTAGPSLYNTFSQGVAAPGDLRPLAAPYANVQDFNGQSEQRSGHALGGSVGHQHLVDRLMREVEKARQTEKKRTSVLLRQPDEAVAKALNIAQSAI